MQQIDRSIPPPIQPIQKLTLPRPRIVALSNGIPMYIIEGGTQDILKLEVVFRAGRPFESAPLVARLTSALLKEGTKRQSGADIAETIDFYGGTLSFPVSLDLSSITLFCLTKHFDRLLPLLTEILTEPTFPQHEMNAFIERSVQRLKVDEERADVVAYRRITEQLYGPEHPYGYNSAADLYAQRDRDELIEHHRRSFTAGNCQIFLSGRPTDQTIRQIDTYLGRALPRGSRLQATFPNIHTGSPQRSYQEMSDQLQTSLRIGRRLFTRHHEDYRGFQVLNCVLGGYFGSRLMSNLREDKGLTYGISSSTDMMLEDGFFLISTDVAKDLREKATEEIYRELERLRTDLIPEEELDMVRNYLLGTFLTILDGPFNVASVTKSLIVEEIPLMFFSEFTQLIRTIDAESLRELARKYLNPDDLWEVGVG